MRMESRVTIFGSPPASYFEVGRGIFRSVLVVFLVVCFWFVAANNTSVHAQSATSHVVRPGETLSSIARQHGVSTSALARYNGIANMNVLRTGQTLRIPAPTSAPSTRSTSPTIAYTHEPVSPAPPRNRYPDPQPSSSTSARPPSNPSSQETLAKPNPVVPRYPLPTPTPPVSTPRYYSVRPNDTLSGIAARFGVSVLALKMRNNIYGDTIYVGQKLVIP